MSTPKKFPSGYDRECPECLSENVDTQSERDTFQYGNKRDGYAELSADIPVRVCRDCECRFTDGEAEDARRDAICEHLGRMKPSEIKALREHYGLSRKEFAEITLLGEASLARWESGELTQNAAYDQLLRLLQFQGNMERLREWQGDESMAAKSSPEYQSDDAQGQGATSRVREALATYRAKGKGSRVCTPKLNADVFKSVLLYMLNKVGAKPNVGETVIYKLFYFIDFDYYEKYEEQLTGATYIKNHHGPTPVEFARVVKKMLEAGEIMKVPGKYFGHDQKKYLPLKDADLSFLSAKQIKHIDAVLARLSDMNASQLSNYSHKDIPWVSAKEKKRLEYEAVFDRTGETSVRSYG